MPHVAGRLATLRVSDPAGPLLRAPRGHLAGLIICLRRVHSRPMGVDPIAVAAHFERFARDVLAPAIYPAAAAMEAAAFQCADPITYVQAAAAGYTPVEIGWEWG